MVLKEHETELQKVALSSKDWVRAAEIVLAVEADGSWKESGLKSITAWLESLSTSYGVSKSWIWRAQQAAKYLPEIWPHHHAEPAKELREILAQSERNISPSAICALSTLAGRGLSEPFLRAAEAAYFSGVTGVTELWRICSEVEEAKERKRDPELHLALFRADFSAVFGGTVRLITDVNGQGFDALFVLADGKGEPEYAGLRLGPLDRSEPPRSLDYLTYLVARAQDAAALDERFGVIQVDTATAQLERIREPKKLSPIGTKQASLRLSVLNHLLCKQPIGRQPEESQNAD